MKRVEEMHKDALLCYNSSTLAEESFFTFLLRPKFASHFYFNFFHAKGPQFTSVTTFIPSRESIWLPKFSHAVSAIAQLPVVTSP